MPDHVNNLEVEFIEQSIFRMDEYLVSQTGRVQYFEGHVKEW